MEFMFNYKTLREADPRSKRLTKVKNGYITIYLAFFFVSDSLAEEVGLASLPVLSRT